MRKADPENAEKQRSAIIQGALKCFAKKGVHGTSTDDICRAAKVSSGTLYYYFKSRDGLIHDVIDHAHAAHDKLLEGLVQAPNLFDAIVNIQLASPEAVKAQGVPIEVYLELIAYSTRNSAAKRAFQEAAENVLATVSEAVKAHQRERKIASDLDAEALAEFIMSAVTGMSIAEIAWGRSMQQRFRDTLSTLIDCSSARADR